MLTHKQMKKRLNECYIELYKHSEPAADFEKLKEEAEVDEFGFKRIPYEDHEIDQAKHDEIVKSFMSNMSAFQKKEFSQTVYLGCSPKFKDDSQRIRY